ncbi:MoxR family ATPase [Oscillospiraceae bacterium OttesenSCG-928-G22]|nr:MoxR family ATPase [Oscillospiraceae bacterium OttesenSCG-928-G22]
MSFRTYEASRRILEELSKVLLGQEEFSALLVTCMFSGGHVLIEGVPGVGKTLSARALAKTVDAAFGRVQFTPDIMPADIIGTNIFDMKAGAFTLRKGPIFTNFLLADEINRTPPKTQSALLEAMEERRVTIDGTDYDLDYPFMVFATQNPLEFEGTYPLPEAQLDRFMMKLIVGYPSPDTEIRLLQNVHGGFNSRDFGNITVEAVLTPDEFKLCQEEIAGVRVDESIFSYILAIVDATRKSPLLALGASPRASVALLSCSKTLALTDGRDYVIPEDVQFLAPHVLRHRVILTPEAEIDGITPDAAISQSLAGIKVPR